MQVFATSKATAGGIAIAPQLTPKYRQAVRIMKLSAILLFAFCMQLSAKGLTQTITLNVKEAPIQKVMQEIEKQTGFVFFYDVSLLRQAKKITMTAEGLPLHQVLEQVFRDQPLTYTISGKNIIISPKEIKKSSNEINIQADLPIDVRGKVVNENSEPVEGVTITVKGTSISTSTNNQGEFSILGVEKNAILIFTHISMETFELEADGRNDLVISLKAKISGLDEVKIIGYGTTTQRVATGNVSKVSSETIATQPITNPLQALQGRVAGLSIIQSSGAPGTAFTIQLRGRNSISAGTDPLFIIDGVPFLSTSLSSSSLTYPANVSLSPLNNINVADIESIEILKDADATSIYGSRGANGVILITTKKGKAGKLKADFSALCGIGKVGRKIDLMSTDDYISMRNEAYSNDGIATLPLNAYDINGTWDKNRFTDWQKLLIGNTSRLSDAQVSLSGGNTNTRFLFGFGYHKETTVFPTDFSDKKVSSHINLSTSSNDSRFKMSLSAFFTSNNNQLPQSDLTRFIVLPPNAPEIYDSAGNLNWEKSTWVNPFSNLLKLHKSKTENLLSNVDVKYEVLKGLVLKAAIGYNNIRMDQMILTPKISLDPSSATLSSTNFGQNKIRTWNVEPQINYTKNFSNHRLELLFGLTFLEQTQNALSQTGTGFSTDALMESLGAATTVSINSVNDIQYKYNAIFGRINYNYKTKYIVDLTGRRDGSSRFGPGNRFSNFGSVGLAWIFSNELFFKSANTFISYGKIRSSYGSTGNDQIGDYQYLDNYTTYTRSYQGIVGLYPLRLLNTNYSWESVKKFEISLDLGFFNDRLLSTITYYNNRTSNQLLKYPLSAITGQTDIIANLPALIENKGIEIEINTAIIKKRDFTWSTSFNISIPRNKLLKYPDIESSSYANTYLIGSSLFIKKLYHFNGVDDQTGIYSFEDYNKDNKISDPDDREFVVNTEQRFFGGIENSFKYRQFRFNFFVQFVKQPYATNYLWNFQMPGTMNNQPTFVLNRWQSPGTIADIQKYSVSNTNNTTAYSYLMNSDRGYSDASFVRLKNISLSYSLSNQINKKLHLQESTVYIQGQNLLTITDYLGLDPEVKGFLPPIRNLAIGVKVGF
jgi:TonB-dependent starch-binding outer membrane protein SusC